MKGEGGFFRNKILMVLWVLEEAPIAPPPAQCSVTVARPTLSGCLSCEVGEGSGG